MTGRTLSEDCRLHGLMMPMPDDGRCWYCARDAEAAEWAALAEKARVDDLILQAEIDRLRPLAFRDDRC